MDRVRTKGLLMGPRPLLCAAKSPAALWWAHERLVGGTDVDFYTVYLSGVVATATPRP